MNTEDLAIRLAEVSSLEGYSFDCQPIPGDVDVVQIIVNEVEEIPVYLSITDSQILCIAYLWSEEEVDPAKRVEMLETMLEMNIPMPLSAFSKIGDRFAIFGALSTESHFEDIVHELVTLNENSIEALEAMQGYLK